MKKPSLSPSPGVWTAIVLVLALLLWEGAAAEGLVDVFFFSSPSLVWQALRDLTAKGILQRHLSVTAREAGLGLLFGGVLGTLAGDDTVIAIMRDNNSAAAFCGEIRSLVN